MNGHLGIFRWAIIMHIAMSPFLPTRILRRIALRMIGIRLPKSSYIAAGTILGSNKISIGERVGINVLCHLDGAADIVLEDNVRLGSGVTIITGTHDIEPSVLRRDLTKPTVPRPVKIGRGSWVAAKVVILPGVTIGEGCVVAAGAVVTRDLPPNGLYGGVPAKLIKELPLAANGAYPTAV
jgi:acetyltransferase-like isoleucine patch superfamily enzyme